MNYYLIANNKNINKKTLINIQNDTNSCIIMYNFLYPINIYPSILKHQNIIYISRQRTSFMDNYKKNIDNNIFPYAGMTLAKEYEQNFKKIIFHSHPRFLSEPRKSLYQSFIDRFGFDQKKLGMLEPYSNNTRKLIQYPSGKSMSTGIISYIYFQNICTYNDTLYLVGFNSNVSKKHHNSDFEKTFFKNEIINNKCKILL